MPFTLDSSYRPKRLKVKGENNPKNQQAVLFAGLNCLPGQNDLFSTDGKERCSLCDAPVARPAITACGVFHPACAEKHATGCEACQRDHFPQ